jgi:multidrug resistance efflux pump
MNNAYEPDDRFVEKLEWQLSSEYRRTNRLKSAPGKIAVSRRLAGVAVLAGLVLTGLTALNAAAYFKNSWRKKIEIARIETEVKLKQGHLASTNEMAGRTDHLFSRGLVGEEENLRMKLAVAKADLDLKTALVDLDEVKASGEIPRNELYAPVVGGRDFVSERLKIRKKRAEQSLKPLESRFQRSGNLLKLGLIPPELLKRIEADMAAEKADIDGIQKRLDLRKQFIAGTITAEEVEITDRMAEAGQKLSSAQSKVDTLQTQLKRIKNLEAVGLISPTETHEMQIALDAAQFELKLAAVEMDVLKKARSRDEPSARHSPVA